MFCDPPGTAGFFWVAGHGFWMAKLRVVEARNFDGIAGFGRGVERFVGFGAEVFYASDGGCFGWT